MIRRNTRLFRIVATKNPSDTYHFVVIDEDMTLAEAQNRLLELYNCFFSNRIYATNWGIAVRQSKKHIEGASATNEDGTRQFLWNDRYFIIERQ